MRILVLVVSLFMASAAGAASADDKNLERYAKSAARVKVTLPSSAKQLFAKNPAYEAVRAWVEEKGNWRRIFQTIELRLGLYLPQGFDIGVEVIDARGGAPALGGGEDEKGIVKIYLPEMAKDFARIEKILTHETIHAVQFHLAREATFKWPSWLYEGMADYGADIRWDFLLLGGTLPSLDGEIARLQAYGRGHLVFLYLEDKYKSAAVKNFINLLAAKKPFKTALKEATKAEWKDFIRDEQVWSEAWMKKPGEASKSPDIHDKAAAGVVLPTADELRAIGAKDKEHAGIVAWLGERKNWAAAMTKIDERLGIFNAEIKVTVHCSSEKAKQAAVGGAGQIAIYLPTLAEIIRTSNVMNDRFIEFTVTHELTHVYLGNFFKNFQGAPFWFVEGLCDYAAENLPNVLTQPTPAASIEKEIAVSSQAYGRGRAFFEYIAATFGEEKVRDLVRSVGEGADYKKAVETVTKLAWDKIVKDEQKWSSDWIKKIKSAYPGLKFKYGE